MIIGLMLARNEAWVIGYSARAALAWCDHLVVLCHACEDETPAIVERLSLETGRVTILWETRESFDEMDYRQYMLEAARELGATHIAIVDGDEILSANLACYTPGIRGKIKLLPPGGVLAVPLHNLWRSLDQYRCDDTAFGRAYVVLAFGDHPAATWKPAADGYHFHQRLPQGNWLPFLRWPADRTERRQGGVMHAQHVSRRRLLAKQAWYEIQEVLRWPHRDRAEILALYSRTVDETDASLLPVPSEWWQHPGLDRGRIRPDDPPWQQEEVNRLVREHGIEAFNGLDLFGVPDATA